MLTKIEDISAWIQEDDAPKGKKQREAIHVLLYALSISPKLNIQTAMKGGVLLAIRYQSSRRTIDVDFSTKISTQEFDENFFKSELEKALLLASNSLTYNMECRIQSFKKNPPSASASWPTYKINIGYAYRSDRNSFKRLQKGESTDIIKIDYSLNESFCNVEKLEIFPSNYIYVYSFFDLIAEKYRSILQQIVRNRSRRQDVYDLYYLINNFSISNDEKPEIVDRIIQSAASRNLIVDVNSISDPGIEKRSKEEYYLLANEVYGDLPDFSIAFNTVKDFYKSLPWP